MVPGKTLSFTLTLSNGGNVNSIGTAEPAVYLSADRTSLTVQVTTVAKRLTVKPGGKAVAVRLKVKVPATAAAGNFYPLVTVAQGSVMATVVAGMPVTVG